MAEVAGAVGRVVMSVVLPKPVGGTNVAVGVAVSIGGPVPVIAPDVPVGSTLPVPVTPVGSD